MRHPTHPAARLSLDRWQGPMTDPITVAVLQNRLNAIAEEMGEAMLRRRQLLRASRWP